MDYLYVAPFAALLVVVLILWLLSRALSRTKEFDETHREDDDYHSAN